MRKTLSSRPVTSLSCSCRPDTALRLSRRPTRSTGFKCARHPSTLGTEDGRAVQLGGVEAVRLSKVASRRSVFVAGCERVSGWFLLVGETGLRSRRSLPVERGEGSGMASGRWERVEEGWSCVPVMVEGLMILVKTPGALLNESQLTNLAKRFLDLAPPLKRA